MKNLMSILIFAALILVSCNTKKKEAAAEEAQIRKMDSLVTQMDSVKTDIDSSMKQVDVLIEDL